MATHKPPNSEEGVLTWNKSRESGTLQFRIGLNQIKAPLVAAKALALWENTRFTSALSEPYRTPRAIRAGLTRQKNLP